jgi:virginiamycin B lyase
VVNLLAAALLLAAEVASAKAACSGSSCVTDSLIAYPDRAQFQSQGSTHEITFNRNGGSTFFITAPTYAMVAEISMSSAQTYLAMPKGSGPHGIVFDDAGKLFVTLEDGHAVVRLDPASGKIVATVPVDADPHGLGVAPDGKTLWFTGKTKNVVGKISPDGKVENFTVPTSGAKPIYIAAGRDGNMWFTELEGSKIGRVTADGKIAEFKIPTENSRPIAIVKDPHAQAMWFSEEAGNKVARIDAQGNIIEFAVPKSQANVILAGLAFDADGNLWVQQYVDQNNPNPAGPDHVVKMDKSIQIAKEGETIAFTSYEVPTRQTVMHRIIQGPDKNMWFTELKSNRIGRVQVQSATSMK